MAIKKTLGGDRLGAGKKQKIELHGYERSTHDLSYLWRSTMSSGTLVPFMKQIGVTGDTWDISLDCDVKTHPTVGPLFGSYKVQLDTFIAPFRLYQGQLHNNELKIGLDMSQIKLPVIELTAYPPANDSVDLDNYQVNPSSLPAYLGIRGIGNARNEDTNGVTRLFNAIGILMYWEVYKNYYANKQEEIGAVIHTPAVQLIETVDDIQISDPISGNTAVPQTPSINDIILSAGGYIVINFTGTQPNSNQILLNTTQFGPLTPIDLCGYMTLVSAGVLQGAFNSSKWGTINITNWNYINSSSLNTGQPAVATFPLENIDVMRRRLLINTSPLQLKINDLGAGAPYMWLYEYIEIKTDVFVANIQSSQEGLGLKTYQSDLFNNWLQTEWIDGTTGINEVTKIDVSSGFLKVDQMILAKKVYDVLNRIAVSGGTYKDWLDVTFDHVVPWIPESPMYMGGLSKELIFQEVVSNSQSSDQPLGTLAGRGVMGNKHKGGNITIKVDEPSMIMGIVSLTPRIDYSQGNDWDVYTLMTMNDIHQPGMDEIGFQELITEQMYWGTTKWDGTKWVQQSVGKQPAWTNYTTNVNKVAGNFAIAGNEMFMTLNRKYDIDRTESGIITDLTTYIDPVKYNQIFAQTALDAQNFWVQIAVNITARRKMSAKVMPNL